MLGDGMLQVSNLDERAGQPPRLSQMLRDSMLKEPNNSSVRVKQF